MFWCCGADAMRGRYGEGEAGAAHSWVAVGAERGWQHAMRACDALSVSEKVRLSALVAQDQLNVRLGGRPGSSSSTENEAHREGAREGEQLMGRPRVVF